MKDARLPQAGRQRGIEVRMPARAVCAEETLAQGREDKTRPTSPDSGAEGMIWANTSGGPRRYLPGWTQPGGQAG